MVAYQYAVRILVQPLKVDIAKSVTRYPQVEYVFLRLGMHLTGHPL